MMMQSHQLPCLHDLENVYVNNDTFSLCMAQRWNHVDNHPYQFLNSAIGVFASTS